MSDPVVERRAELSIGTALVRVGDPVEVAGWRGRFTFQEVVTNTATGQRWANVFGGPAGRERARSVDPDRLRAAERRPSGEQLSLDLGPPRPGR